ncbi:hypothetical protein AAVH_42977 [Aphelenchoides avenae]|nr:hypothetical protein AAVH_42977 [Aphelenchus avenae]
MLDVGKRLMFNYEQIEKRYCGPNHIDTGIVVNTKTGEESYDPDLCNAKDEEEHLQAVKNLHVLTKQGPVLSTPEPDPEETDPEKIKLWKKMNKEFEKYCKEQSALVPVKNGNHSEKRTSRRSHPYADFHPVAHSMNAAASSSRGILSSGSLKVNRLHGSPFNNSARHAFAAPFMPLKKYHITSEPVAAHFGAVSSQAALILPKANTRSSARASMLKSGKQPNDMDDGTESIRSGFGETRNQVALVNAGQRLVNQSRMPTSSLALPAPEINKGAFFKKWVANSMKHTSMKDLDS